MLKTLNLILILALAIILVAAGFYWFTIRDFGVDRHTRIDSAVLQSEIREIAELSTVVYVYQGIASLDEYSAGRFFGREWRWPGTSRSLIMRYDGEVRFGVDFDRIIVDVNNIANTLTIIMPPARIMTHTADLNTVHVFDDSAGLFVRRSVYDTTATIANAQASKAEWLIEKGMLEKASENAENLIRRFVEALLSQYGEEFEIVFR